VLIDGDAEVLVNEIASGAVFALPLAFTDALVEPVDRLLDDMLEHTKREDAISVLSDIDTLAIQNAQANVSCGCRTMVSDSEDCFYRNTRRENSLAGQCVDAVIPILHRGRSNEVQIYQTKAWVQCRASGGCGDRLYAGRPQPYFFFFFFFSKAIWDIGIESQNRYAATESSVPRAVEVSLASKKCMIQDTSSMSSHSPPNSLARNFVLRPQNHVPSRLHFSGRAIVP
jgi:hypothetical protein